MKLRSVFKLTANVVQCDMYVRLTFRQYSHCHKRKMKNILHNVFNQSVV